ncbi:ribonuclease HI, partial [Trypanosoma cruzi]
NVQAPWLCVNGWALNRTFASESSLNGSCFIAGNFFRCSTTSSALRWHCIARRAGKSRGKNCFALLNDSELTLRELTVDGTVRVCVYWALLLLLLGLCGVVAAL